MLRRFVLTCVAVVFTFALGYSDTVNGRILEVSATK